MKPGTVSQKIHEPAQVKPAEHPLPHLPFPFGGKVEIRTMSKGNTAKILAESARSLIEIFQSACYRQSRDLEQPLVLLFEDPNVQYFCLQNYLKPVEQILADHETGLVVSVLRINPGRDKGSHIRAFAGLRCVILANPGFAETYGIEQGNTIIHLKPIAHAQ